MVSNSFCGDISLLKDEDNCLTEDAKNAFYKEFDEKCKDKNNCNMNLGKLLDKASNYTKAKKVYV